MPYENCENCKKCFPCPVTSSDKREGAYPIAQDTGNVWYCTSCFYCEDNCPDYSPRQYAIDKRRLNEQSSKEMIEPLEQLKQHGTLFPLSEGIKQRRVDMGLPILPQSNITEIRFLYEQVHKKERKTVDKERDLTGSKLMNKTTIALFLGCLIPYRMLEYELSTRNILEKLDINYCDLPFACCGSIMTESQSEELWLVSGAYNLALAEEQGVEILLTICGGCTGDLRRVNQRLKKDSVALKLVNSYLANISKHYKGGTVIHHFSEYLLEEENRSQIKAQLNSSNNDLLKKISVGTQVPCQVIRPADTSPHADVGAALLSDILSLTSINTIHFPFETLCCGSSMLLYDEEIAHNIAAKRIASLQKRDADALVMGCGNCSMNYTIHQGSYTKNRLPTLFFTEIIDFALGEENEQLRQILEKKEKDDE